MVYNISERYVSPGVAKLLHKNGFNENCGYVYRIDWQGGKATFMCVESIPNWDDYRGALNEQLPEGYISAPVQSMACDWVEKAHGLFIEISRSIDLNGNYHYFYVISDNICNYSFAASDNDYSSKSDAIDAALEHVLTKLI
jgi:hypothetical protein